MGEGDGEEISQVFQKEKLPSILGKEDFVYWVKNRFFERKLHIEVPDKERIQKLVCRTYGITKGELVKSKRGTFNEPRGVAIYLRVSARNNYTKLRRILVRILGTSTGAYFRYVPVDVTQ
jgi:hypothetical protein